MIRRIPGSELVAQAWVSTMTDLLAELVGGVASTLPAQSKWGKPVFVTTTTIGGLTSKTSPLRGPVVQLDCWAAEGKLGEVQGAAEYLREATYTAQGLGLLTPKAGFESVRLLEVSVETEPNLVRGDPAALARATLDLLFVYTIVEG